MLSGLLTVSMPEKDPRLLIEMLPPAKSESVSVVAVVSPIVKLPSVPPVVSNDKFASEAACG